MLREFVKSNHYKFAVEAANWRTAIAMSCEPLEQDGTIETNYKEEIIKGVEKYGPYIIITPNVALPHAQEGALGVNKTAISFMKLDKPVSFEPGNPEYDAQLFFTLASCDPQRHLKNLAKLTELLTNENILKALVSAETPEDLLKIQEQFLDKGDLLN